LNPGESTLQGFENVVSFVRRSRWFSHGHEDDDGQCSHDRHTDEQDLERVSVLAEPLEEEEREDRSDDRSGLVHRLVNPVRVAAVAFARDVGQPGVSRWPPKTLAKALDDAKTGE
jgi:hypothetical protein